MASVALMPAIEDETSQNEELIAAATVLLLREERDELEVLMLRRNSKIAFGGMWVFPGGRVDDHELGPDELESARTAAARETKEEAGLDLDRNQLLTWSHWQPPAAKDMVNRKGPLRRFSTWFFVAAAPSGEVAIDHGEIHEDAWMRPAVAMEKHQVGEIELVPPTWITLYQLAQHSTMTAALDWAAATEPARFWTKPLGKQPPVLVWEGDAAYESLESEAVEGRNRLTLHPDGWLYEQH